MCGCEQGPTLCPRAEPLVVPREVRGMGLIRAATTWCSSWGHFFPIESSWAGSGPPTRPEVTTTPSQDALKPEMDLHGGLSHSLSALGSVRTPPCVPCASAQRVAPWPWSWV